MSLRFLTVLPVLASFFFFSWAGHASAQSIDFGDDSSEWANDGECDDPRFEGDGMAILNIDDDILRDATDCREAYEAGTIRLAGADIDYGDDSSTWANDGECDDPRFSGTGMAETLLDSDRGADATDCRAGVERGDLTFTGDRQTVQRSDGIYFGDDSSEWANDGECDDPRFAGEGMAATLLDEDINRDASDCRAGVERGELRYKGVN
ncbi:MAG: hypothetical protein MRY72_11610 [Aquisalinus sp.]|nr:hypothetical protein [Aquisalinus sp.]